VGCFGGKVKLGMKLHNDDVEDLLFGTLNLLLVDQKSGGAGVASEEVKLRLAGRRLRSTTQEF